MLARPPLGKLESRLHLAITFAHAEAATSLPLHHPDPFDRMLIAQAQVERLTLVTRNRSFEPYDVRLLWT